VAQIHTLGGFCNSDVFGVCSAMCATWDCAVCMDTLWLCSCLYFSDFTKDVMNLCFILYFAVQHFIFTIVAYFDEL